jgi:bacterial DNA-binding protein
MAEMTMQQRYSDIANKSGLSEDVVKRVLKASRDSLVDTLEEGYKATLPGIVTFEPKIRERYKQEGEKGHYIKVGAKASASLGTDLAKRGGFNRGGNETERVEAEQEVANKLLNFVGKKEDGIITRQISSLV